MLRCLFFLLLLLPFQFFGQSFQQLQKKSTTAQVFRIDAFTTKKILENGVIDIDKYAEQLPYAIFPIDSILEELLPNGQYLVVKAEDSMINVSLIQRTTLFIYPVNNQQQLQINVRNVDGKVVAADVWVKGKKAKPIGDSGTYMPRLRNLGEYEEALTMVCSKNDTAFFEMEEIDDWRNPPPMLLQYWQIFKRTKTFKAITWLPLKVAGLFKKQRKVFPSPYSGAKGLLVFNQPKYKLGDTVRLKAYIYDKHLKSYTKEANLFLEYFNREKKSQLLGKVKPTQAGSYIFELILRDTLINDLNYSVVFKDTKKKILLKNDFKIEDYLLDDMSTIELRSNQSTFYSGDSLNFWAQAKDANGLSVLDATAQLIVTPINSIIPQKDIVYISDTIYSKKIPLNTNGETLFAFDTKLFPPVEFSAQAKLIITNSNNEQQEKKLEFYYIPEKNGLYAEQKSDSVFCVFWKNGIPTKAIGKIRQYGLIEKNRNIIYPIAINIDPLAESYIFEASINDSVKIEKEVTIDKQYLITLRKNNAGDSAGFVLDNPFGISVNFAVYRGNHLLLANRSESKTIAHKFFMGNIRQMLTVKWDYYWAGKEHHQVENIAVLDKLLQVDVTSAKTVFPGQTDSVQIKVADYYNKPTANVNLTVFSYNNQFSKQIRVNDPPYLKKYINRPQIQYPNFEISGANFKSNFSLGKHRLFINKLGLDSLLYYQVLFPKDTMVHLHQPIANAFPQVSVHMVKKGVPQTIYLLYVNNQLVYYHGTTDESQYAFEGGYGYTKLGIRLRDSYVEIDSIYLQPYYKHDLIFDLDNLPISARSITQPNYYSTAEKAMLNRQLITIENQGITNKTLVWQGNKAFRLKSSGKHLVGPFLPEDSLHTIVPNAYRIDYKFEPGYSYRLSDKVIRLEKNELFPFRKEPYYLPLLKNVFLHLGDTILPVENMLPKTTASNEKNIYYFLNTTNVTSYFSKLNSTKPKGHIQFSLTKDTVYTYVIIKSISDTNFLLIDKFNNYRMAYYNLPIGKYQLLLVMKNLSCSVSDSFEIKPFKTLLIRFNNKNYVSNLPFLNQLFNEQNKKKTPIIVPEPEPESEKPVIVPSYIAGKTVITGTVTDAKGKLPISGVTVLLKGTKIATITDSYGKYTLQNIGNGVNTIVFSSVGYNTKEMPAIVLFPTTLQLNVSMTVTSAELNDVVVVGYGTSRKKDLTGSIATVTNKNYLFDNTISGRVAGVQVNSNSGSPGSTYQLTLRGVSSFSSSNNPLFVIDGIAYQSMPENITADMIESMEVVKDASAVQLYGHRASNGVIIITTKTIQQRTNFRDYAFWQPELITDKNGIASFKVKYPDNVTGWQTFVIAMDKKLRIGKSITFTQSYKPLLAQLSVPRFLTERDSTVMIGKMLNYTNDSYKVKSNFSIKNGTSSATNHVLTSAASQIDSFCYKASNTDTVNVSYNLQTETGFKDGETRKIPVEPYGTEEVSGKFWVLKADTTVLYSADKKDALLYISGENKVLDVLLKELDHLKKYPYWCMEQTASKLHGLLLEKQIQTALSQKFTDQKEIDLLIQKLQKAQQFDGGWPWWDGGKSNYYVTTHILKVLQQSEKNPIIQQNIRNGILYIQQLLPKLSVGELLEAMLTLSISGHEMNYETAMSVIHFDSLTQHEQWQWVAIRQKVGLEYHKQLKQLIEKNKGGITGSIYWGSENYRWYSNSMATTILAYKVLVAEKKYSHLLPGLLQYFLEEKKNGYWRNTVESAGVVAAILPDLLSQNKLFMQPASLKISGDTNFLVHDFPFRLKLPNNVKNIAINKIGGGISYVSVYQKYLNKQPEPVAEDMQISTSFEQGNLPVKILEAGKKATMHVTVTCKKNADYLMLEIPIPAGCVYAEKPNTGWGIHRAYFKNKVLIFAESLYAGIHNFDINLEVRYSGNYIINPAKSSLMYFPTFFGRNELKNILVK